MDEFDRELLRLLAELRQAEQQRATVPQNSPEQAVAIKRVQTLADRLWWLAHEQSLPDVFRRPLESEVPEAEGAP